ncbi:MAG: hypothetical protein WCF84_08690 [Anaerolineae bacterium]
MMVVKTATRKQAANPVPHYKPVEPSVNGLCGVSDLARERKKNNKRKTGGQFGRQVSHGPKRQILPFFAPLYIIKV